MDRAEGALRVAEQALREARAALDEIAAIRAQSQAPKATLIAPDDVAVNISKAVMLLATSPIVGSTAAAPAAQPIVMNVHAGDRGRRTLKTITTRRDENGNLVADVVETVQ